MAKAALNMMTRTSAEALSKRRVFMNAVDTGWINDENPLHKAAKVTLLVHTTLARGLVCQPSLERPRGPSSSSYGPEAWSTSRVSRGPGAPPAPLTALRLGLTVVTVVTVVTVLPRTASSPRPAPPAPLTAQRLVVT
eukprot:1079716-Prorocentrum_minimum.AAC.1